MTDGPAQPALSLPGIEPTERAVPPLVDATRRTIAALVEAQLVNEQHAMHCQLMLDMAESVASATRYGKASAAALAAAQLLAAWDHLPKPETGEEEDAWTVLGNELRETAKEVERDYRDNVAG